MKNRVPSFARSLSGIGLVAGVIFLSIEPKTVAAEPPIDPIHAAHVASGVMPPEAAKADPALSQQLSQLQAKVAQLEAALSQNAPRSPVAAEPATDAMPGMPAPAAPMAGMKSPPPVAMKPAGAMSGMAAPPGGAANMMGMMDKMMGMMDKMMSPGGGTMPASAPTAGGMGMGMEMMQSEMGAMSAGSMPAAAPALGMSGMAMDKMEMAGMMGMGAMGSAGAMPKAGLPGFPGASHLYHIGATGFFLDHPQHIALSTEQQAGLNKAREQAALAAATADRAVKQAEQELWTLTAADQPDVSKIEAKIGEIGKLTGDKRLAFIRAVGSASQLLTDAQRKILAGFAAPAPAAVAMAGGMKGM